jgi:LysR family transcriptional activator of nhaA
MMERLDWLNYHHLLYFWVVAKEGGLQPAGKVLGLTHSTLSAQIHALEDRLGEKLLAKSGRKLALTESGRIVFRYAEEIFGLGRELLSAIKGRSGSRKPRLDVGIVDVVPKIVVRRLLQPALELDEPVLLACHEDSLDRLLADLSLHSLDLVISDSPLPSGSSVRAFNHLLGETGITFFGTRALQRHGDDFPRRLDGAPMLLPLENVALRRSLNQWFNGHGISPRVVAEFEDSALMKVFGGDGVGVFPSPTVVEREIVEQYGVRVLGRADDVRERFYAISAERRLKHPAVVAISEAARDDLFVPHP